MTVPEEEADSVSHHSTGFEPSGPPPDRFDYPAFTSNHNTNEYVHAGAGL